MFTSIDKRFYNIYLILACDFFIGRSAKGYLGIVYRFGTEAYHILPKFKLGIVLLKHLRKLTSCKL